MNILIAGASGFIGRELVENLVQNNSITVLGRSMSKLEEAFPGSLDKLTWENLPSRDATSFDLIINLSGSNIGARRWRPSVKKELIESRTSTNQDLVTWLLQYMAKPRFFCANAVGVYGAQERSTDFFDEDTIIPSSSDDFLQQIGIAWEQSLQTAIEASISVTILRFGVVLKKGQGMLKKLELPFRLGAGSVLGSGLQTLSWVHYKDLVNAFNFLIEHPEITGPVNITAPLPVTQKVFAKALAKSLNRPLFFKTPSWVIKTLFGEMGEYLLLKGQKVSPKRLTELGFEFACADIETALSNEYE